LQVIVSGEKVIVSGEKVIVSGENPLFFAALQVRKILKTFKSLKNKQKRNELFIIFLWISFFVDAFCSYKSYLVLHQHRISFRVKVLLTGISQASTKWAWERKVIGLSRVK
jgi:hypothetical protein